MDAVCLGCGPLPLTHKHLICKCLCVCVCNSDVDADTKTRSSVGVVVGYVGQIELGRPLHVLTANAPIIFAIEESELADISCLAVYDCVVVVPTLWWHP